MHSIRIKLDFVKDFANGILLRHIIDMQHILTFKDCIENDIIKLHMISSIIKMYLI